MSGKSNDSPPDYHESIYLKRYAWPVRYLNSSPTHDTGIIVVIPCYTEPNVLASLEALDACFPTECRAEVIVVVNYGIHESDETKNTNQHTSRQIKDWIRSNQNPRITFHTIEAYELPEKIAGVGLARKIGMDEAVRRFESVSNSEGIIVCFDADCHCSPNYLQAIEQYYAENTEATAGLLHFEHDLSEPDNDAHRNAIINYELHLRYYVQALKYALFPYAQHTIGSCITVRSEVYKKQGGMNTRKAGEDFYFLQKLFALGGVNAINMATVYPSSRPSLRVPFGTGKAVIDILSSENAFTYYSYHPEIFIELGTFNVLAATLWDIKNTETFIEKQSSAMKRYLDTIPFIEQVSKIRDNAKSESQFIKAFYAWFNGFQVLKYVHFARDHYYGKMEIYDACLWVLNALHRSQFATPETKEELLILLRSIEQSE